jgi:hypothetical protein
MHCYGLRPTGFSLCVFQSDGCAYCKYAAEGNNHLPPHHFETSQGAQVAPQHCPILPAGKSKYSISVKTTRFNVKSGGQGVQFKRESCPIQAERLSKMKRFGCLIRAVYPDLIKQVSCSRK